MTKVNKWTLGLAALGLVSLPVAVQAQSTTEKPNQLLTALSSTTMSGYVDSSIHWNPGSGNANVPGFAFNGQSKSDGFNLDVVNVVLEKPLDESTWSAGYKVDLIYGPNAEGWNNSFSSSGSKGSDTDFGIKQAYVAVRAPIGNGLDLKLGTFDTIISNLIELKKRPEQYRVRIRVNYDRLAEQRNLRRLQVGNRRKPSAAQPAYQSAIEHRGFDLSRL